MHVKFIAKIVYLFNLGSILTFTKYIENKLIIMTRILIKSIMESCVPTMTACFFRFSLYRKIIDFNVFALLHPIARPKPVRAAKGRSVFLLKGKRKKIITRGRFHKPFCTLRRSFAPYAQPLCHLNLIDKLPLNEAIFNLKIKQDLLTYLLKSISKAGHKA